MSDPFKTLVDHQHSSHVALRNLFARCLELAREGTLARSTMLDGVADAVTALRAHHRYEDDLLIPRMREAGHEGPWDDVEEEHLELQRHLEALEAAPADGLDDLSDLVEPLEAIDALLAPHFDKEEAGLTESDWRRIFDDDPEAARAFGKEVAAHNRAGLQPATRMLALLLYNLDDATRARFTDRMPTFLIEGLVPYAFRPAWRGRRAFMSHPPARLTPRPLQGWMSGRT